MCGSLTTLIHDAAGGQPMAGIRVQLYWVENHGDVLVRAGATNARGTTDSPLLANSKLSAGTYKLLLHVGDYYAAQQHPDAKRYLDVLPIVFVVDDASTHTQIDVTVTPSTYIVAHQRHG